MFWYFQSWPHHRTISALKRYINAIHSSTKGQNVCCDDIIMNDVMLLDTVKNWECCATVLSLFQSHLKDRDCFLFLLFECILQKMACGFLLRSLLIHLVFNISLRLVKNNKLFLCYMLMKHWSTLWYLLMKAFAVGLWVLITVSA